MFTDTYDEINGVATVLHALVDHAAAEDWPFTLVTCGAERASCAGPRDVRRPSTSLSLGVYQEFPFAVAPIFELLRWCEETEVELIHAATPGPVGMRRRAAGAHRSALPLVATYHTDVPRLGFFLTRDRLLEEVLWSYVRWFYGQCDVVFCPSQAIRQEDLAEHDVRSRFEPFDQAIDETALHARAAQRRELHRRLGEGKKVVLWVGRISAEKGLEALAAVYDELLRAPRRRAARRGRRRAVPRASSSAWLRARRFLGVRTGDELAEIYASADVFVFPGLRRDVRPGDPRGGRLRPARRS